MKPTPSNMAITDGNPVEKFDPLIYSMDVFFPIVDLRQQANWTPSSQVIRAWMWLEITLGWMLSTIAVAGYSGVLRKERR